MCVAAGVPRPTDVKGLVMAATALYPSFGAGPVRRESGAGQALAVGIRPDDTLELAQTTESRPHSGRARERPVRFAIQERPAAGRARIHSRRVAHPLPVAGVALTLLVLVAMLGWGAAADKKTAVLVTTRSLPAGSLLTAACCTVELTSKRGGSILPPRSWSGGRGRCNAIRAPR